MRVITDTVKFNLEQPSIITLGKFDGVHIGHRRLISSVIRQAEEKKLTSILFTFDIPPKAKLTNVLPKVILTNEEKREVIKNEGMDILIECPFLPEIMNMEPEDFIKEILVDGLKVKHIVVGTDFRFGANRRGTPKLLSEQGKIYGFSTEVLDKVSLNNQVVSSTFIREEIEAGHMDQVKTLLGYPYFITGEVVHGRQLGRRLGVPTINQIPPGEKLLPKRGVYASVTTIRGFKVHGMTNIGIKPTVMGNFEGAETYLFDFNDDAYGANVKVELLSFQRPEKKFDSLEALKQQLKKDENKAKKYFAK